MHFWEIIEITFTAVVLAISIYKTVKSIIRLSKDRTLYPMILQYITEAEATGKSGPEKLKYVVEHIEAFAKTQGLSIDLIYIKDLIERIIEVTKKVNING